MPDDPRVRLTGLTDERAGTPVLVALDGITIEIVVGRDVIPTARLAIAATASIAARLFGRVDVRGDDALPSNWWGARTVTELTERVARRHLATPPARRYTVAFGADVAAGTQVTLGVGGGDYLARVGTDLQPVNAASHAFGVHAAGSLAVGHLLGLALADVTVAPEPLPPSYVLDLVTHRVGAGPAAGLPVDPRPLRAVFAGAGSVTSSALALLSMVDDDLVRQLLDIGIIDHDHFDPARNSWRCPALTGGETGSKADYLAARLRARSFRATGSHETVGEWTRRQLTPGLDGLLVSSVDTVSGRLQVADVLARDTLSLGVAGTAVHAQREHLGDGFACPFCDYVSAAPPLTQASLHAEITGLPVERVLQLSQPGQTLTAADLSQAVGAGRVHNDRAAALVGRTLHDLVRQAYAELTIIGPGADGIVAVASPHVSWFAGVLAAVEIVKQIVGLPLLDRRVDADIAGLPPGIVRQMPADPTGRCVCTSGIRRHWQRELYGAA